MDAHYSHTTWRVKHGQEDEFVRCCGEWAEWSHRQGLDAQALLLRDLDSPETFVSFGPWASLGAIRSWRALEGYQERVARLREIVDQFEPRTLQVTARR